MFESFSLFQISGGRIYPLAKNESFATFKPLEKEALIQFLEKKQIERALFSFFLSLLNVNL